MAEPDIETMYQAARRANEEFFLPQQVSSSVSRLMQYVVVVNVTSILHVSFHLGTLQPALL
jgi:hypothetical protein